MKYLLLFAIAAISLQCSPKLSPDASWGRERWVLVEMKGVPVQQGGRGDAFINFQVYDKRFTGNGGCNQINGNYTVEKSAISFSDVISTKMACNDLAFETTFLESLGNVNRFEMNGGDLYLKNNREILLILRAR